MHALRCVVLCYWICRIVYRRHASMVPAVLSSSSETCRRETSRRQRRHRERRPKYSDLISEQECASYRGY